MDPREVDGATASAQIARAIFAGARARGFAVTELCARFGIDPSVLDDADARLPAPVLFRLWNEVPLLVGDPHFGLTLAERAEASAASMIGYLFQSGATVRDGILRAVRFHRLLQDLKDTRVESISGGLRITHGAANEATKLPRHALDFGMAIAVVFARRASGIELRAAEVATENAAPDDVEPYVRVFGVRPRFGAAVNSIIFDDVTLDTPLRTADPVLASILERRANDLIAQLPQSNGVLARVRRLLCEGFRDGEPTLDSIAARMHTTPRTLQRQLREHGTTFRDLLDGLRRDLAERYLRDENMVPTQVAFVLGFHDASAFHRAFVRWTGQTPGHFRRAAATQRSGT